MRQQVFWRPTKSRRSIGITGLDQFHAGSLAATEAMAALAGVASGMTVLDVGAGIGGPERWLAAPFGCHVTCLDLTPEYCEAAEALTKYAGLDALVEVRLGDALETPFSDGSFDLVWAQGSFMNIQDKARLFHELHRVLKPGGKLAFQEIVAGPNQPIYFPVGWADRPEVSFRLQAGGRRPVDSPAAPTWPNSTTADSRCGRRPSSVRPVRIVTDFKWTQPPTIRTAFSY